jgi:nucleosome binding factor SPN SPT16 subunit
VSYNISGDKDDNDKGDDEDGEEEDGAEEVRRSKRSKEERLASESAAQARAVKQQELMEKKLAEARRRIKQGDTGDGTLDELNEADVKDLQVYKSAAEFPKDAHPNRLKMDIEKEALLVPINGQLVPFHISTIKNMTQPDPDMRINFYIPGATMSKEVPKNMQQLIFKYGNKSTFIKELTFRSTDGKSLATVYNQFVEVRKKIRQREQKAEQEKDLVIQEKLIRIKDQRVPRLQEVTMRPQLSGRKCVGNIEAHQNGLRFTSSKAEVLDVMYANIKHVIFQPCDRTTMVLIHFHLNDHILIGKKKQKDVQFFTEVIESSLNLEGARRSSYDPDELDDEQREREMRKRLNLIYLIINFFS